MVFTAYLFPVFLLCTIILYYTIPAKFRWVVLLLASLCFYCIAGVKYLPFILFTGLITYGCALFVSRKNESIEKTAEEITDKNEIKKMRANAKKQCKAVNAFAIVIVVGYLLFTKFGTNLLEAVNSLTQNGITIDVIVPLGISYYTFASIGYMLDVYWKRYNAETNFFRYFLYLIYFPHILQGPIPRYDRLGFQMREEHKFEYKRVCFGMQLMLWGYFQKLVIADRLGIFVKTVFDDCVNQYGFVLLIAILFYAVQIYADFAGCVNIAKGISQIFGLTLDDNFRQPYFSQSVEEFWRRWHITLGAWFKDYLCMPVSTTKLVKETSKKARKKWGSQAGRNVTTISALIVVWICTGIWHGTGLNYIIWAVWQGGIIIFSLLMEKHFIALKDLLRINDASGEWKVFRIIRTFILTGMIPRVITRAASLRDAAIIFKNIFSWINPWVFVDDSLYNYGLSRKSFFVGLVGIAVLITVSVLKEKNVSIRATIAQKSIITRWTIYIIALFSIIIFGVYGTTYEASSFLYMGF